MTSSPRLIVVTVLVTFGMALAGCGSDSPSPPPPVANPPPPPPPDQDGALQGDPASPAQQAVANVNELPLVETASEDGLLLARLGVIFDASATVGQVNEALASVDGTIVYSRSGSLLLEIDIPTQDDAAALLALAESLETQPGVVAAFTDRIPATQVLPGEAQGEPVVATEELLHLLPTGFPAAWNASSLLAGCESDPIRIVVADKFARTDPAGFLAQLPPGIFQRDDRFWLAALLPGDLHGYQVTMAMAGIHDTINPTGAHPRAQCLRIEMLDASGRGLTALAQELAEVLDDSAGKVIVQASLGFGDNFCGLGTSSCEVSGPFSPTRRQVRDAVSRRVASGIAWAREGMNPANNGRVLSVVAAGNSANDPIGIHYQGFSSARFGFFPQMTEHLPRIAARLGDEGIGTEYWFPRGINGEPPPASLPPAALDDVLSAALQREFDALNKREIVESARNVVTVGALRAPGRNEAGELIEAATSTNSLRRASFSNAEADLHAIGTDVLLGDLDGSGLQPTQGTSFSAPQVSGLVAYLWSLSPELRGLPVEATLRHLQATAQQSADFEASGVIDAYAAVLALDRPGEEKRIRTAILDVDGNGVFDDRDIELYLEAFETRENAGQQGPDFSRFDLNGDGHTGGPGTRAMDLDAEEYDTSLFPDFGRPVRSTIELRIEGDTINFDENGVTDLEALCYFAYEPTLIPYTGSPQRRRELLGAERCARPLRLDTIFPASFSGTAGLEVTVTRNASGAQGAIPVADLLLRFTPSCGFVSDPEARTDENGRVNVTVTPSEACIGSISISIEAIEVFDEAEGEVIVASTVVTGNLFVQSGLYGNWRGGLSCGLFEGSTEVASCGGDPITLEIAPVGCGGDLDVCFTLVSGTSDCSFDIPGAYDSPDEFGVGGSIFRETQEPSFIRIGGPYTLPSESNPSGFLLFVLNTFTAGVDGGPGEGVNCVFQGTKSSGSP